MVDDINSTVMDSQYEKNVQLHHSADSISILLYTVMLIITLFTMLIFKNKRLRFVHETGMALLFGVIVGAIVHYASKSSMDMLAGNHTGTTSNNQVPLAIFDSEIFFNIILPPIIFHAGYSLKRKSFFNNIGTILCYAFIGTTISTFVIGGVQFGFSSLFHIDISFADCLFFGALVSATDPVTILAIFSDLKVDTNLYALVFGEAVLNDAVAIVLVTSIDRYVFLYSGAIHTSATNAFFGSFVMFLYVFCGSFVLGCACGCFTALLMKHIKFSRFPLLETSVFVLMSYCSFLIAESFELSGIVAVLFCGISQAHYTYNNLSIESKTRTRDFFQTINLLAESFVFSYIGFTLFNYPNHSWNVIFIAISFVSIFIGRFLNIYPLSFLLNLKRKPKISFNFQHMLFLSGLRGAIAFALAIRSTSSLDRQMILSATSIIVIVTVLFGGCTTQFLSWLSISVGCNTDEQDQLSSAQSTVYDTLSFKEPDVEFSKSSDNFSIAYCWSNIDRVFFKPLLTHARPTLIDTLPSCCYAIARLLTSTEQLNFGKETRTGEAVYANQ